jgi:hypothetical protein
MRDHRPVVGTLFAGSLQDRPVVADALSRCNDLRMADRPGGVKVWPLKK